MNNSKSVLSLSDKINQSFNAKIEDVVKINEYDKNSIFNTFREEERRNKIANRFLKKIKSVNKIWEANIEKCKEIKSTSLKNRQLDLMRKLKLKSGVNAKKIKEIQKEKEELKKIMREESHDAYQKSREKILVHLEKVEKQRQEYQRNLNHKENLLEQRNIRNLKKIKDEMHNKLEKSFDRNYKCKSQLDILEQENNAKKEEKKFQQFHDFYFFFEDEKKKRKEASQIRIEKMENNFKQRNNKVKEIKEKNSNTMKKIAHAIENKNRATKRIREYLTLKKVEHEQRTSHVFKFKSQLDLDREEENKEIMAKQMDFIHQNMRMEESNKLKSQHKK